MKPAVTVEGGRELRAKLKAVDDKLPKRMAVIHRDAAEPVAQKAGGFVPRLTGTLAASIKAAGTQREGRVQAGGRSVRYAGPIHYGWAAHNIEPHPFLTDALAGSETQIRDDFDQGVAALLDDVFGPGTS